jgi:hypothetical protein
MARYYLRFLLIVSTVVAALSAQAPNVPSDQTRAIVGRLDLQRFKAHIKGLTQFGDRIQGTQRNSDAIGWLEKQLRDFGYTNVQRQRFMSNSGPLENIYATKVGASTPVEMYIVSAHMDGRGGGEAADDDGSGCAVVLELARVLGMSDVRTNRSIRFIFWNNEEFGMDGSGTYASERASLQGTPDEPKWLGVIQHDMMMYDHGLPPGPNQSPTADINIEYQKDSTVAAGSARLAEALQASNKLYAKYPATIGTNMASTDSIRFEDLVPAVSVREAERITGIIRGSNPHHHEATDRFETYSEEDFMFGFNSVQTTMGALGQLAGITIARGR